MNGDRTTLFLCGIIIAFTAALFHLFGVTDSGYDPATATRSLFVWLSRRWTSYSGTQDDFPYGWAAPLVSLWMVWRLRRELAAAVKSISIAGLALIVLALLLHWLGARTQQTRISFAAFILLLWAIPFHLYGWRVARMLIVPAGFLFFMIQLDFLAGLSLKFRQMQVSVASGLINGLGLSEVDRRELMYFSVPGCSGAMGPGGLRSIMLVAAVSVVLAWLRQRGIVRQLALLSAIPVVVFIAAVLRLTISGFLLSAPQMGTSIWMTIGFYLATFALIFAWHRFLNRPKPIAFRSEATGDEP